MIDLQKIAEDGFKDELEKIAISQENKIRLSGVANLGIGGMGLNMARKDIPYFASLKNLSKSDKILKHLIKYVGLPISATAAALGATSLIAPNFVKNNLMIKSKDNK